MSSTPPSEAQIVRSELAGFLNREIVSVERIGGGFNSQVYRVAAANSERFALKIYFRHAGDKRDRLTNEFGSFSYLWANGFHEIPQPLLSNPRRGWAVYQFIEGEKIPRGQAGNTELLSAADFLGRLRDLSREPESRNMAAASEAFFAVNQIVENVRQRLSRLDSLPEDSTPYLELRAFIADELKPLLSQAVGWSESRLNAAGQSFAGELKWSERTLSPSDFGFHNALRQPDGRMIFLDFEYFGWDDPAKMIVDFLLHPAMDLSPDAKKKFASALVRRFLDWPGLIARVESVYPLFGLKWCLIILNEFLPEQLLRRQFAATGATDRSTLQMQQLEKAKHMLNRIRQEYQCFPYHE